MKKIFVLLCAVMLALFCAGVAYASDRTCEDFETGVLPGGKNGAVIRASDGTVAAKSSNFYEKAPEQGRPAQASCIGEYYYTPDMRGNNGKNYSDTYSLGGEKNSTVLFETDVYIPNDKTGYLQFGFLTSDGNAYTAANPNTGNQTEVLLGRIMSDGNGKFGFITNNTFGDYSYFANKWYSIKIILDFEKSTLKAMIKDAAASDSEYEYITMKYYQKGSGQFAALTGDTYFYNNGIHLSNASFYNGVLSDDITDIYVSRPFNGTEAYMDNISFNVYAPLYIKINSVSDSETVYKILKEYEKIGKFDFDENENTYNDCAYSCGVLAKGTYESNEALLEAWEKSKNPYTCSAVIYKEDEKNLYKYEFSDYNGYIKGIDRDGYIICNSFEKGLISAKLSCLNNTGDPMTVKLILAQYKDGELIKLGYNQDDAASGLTKDIKVSVDVTETDGSILKLIALKDDMTPMFNNIQSIAPMSDKERTLWLVGDSICHENDYTHTNDKKNFPYQGWGTYASAYLDDKINVINKSLGGWSTRAYLEGPITGDSYNSEWGKNNFMWYKAIYPNINSGDTVIVALGINDTNTTLGTTLEQYKTNLKKFISDCREKNAEIILLTPTIKAYGTPGESATAFEDSYAERGDIVRKVGREENVKVVDIASLETDYLTETAVKYNEEAGKDDDDPYGYIKVRREFWQHGSTVFAPVSDGGYGIDFKTESSLKDADGKSTSVFKQMWNADENGMPVLDSDGNPTYKYKDSVHYNINSADILARLIFEDIAKSDTILSEYVKIPYNN